jgi:hypothetical protein
MAHAEVGTASSPARHRNIGELTPDPRPHQTPDSNRPEEER